MDNTLLDKTLIYINSSNSVYLNNTEQKFYLSLQEPIKNATYIKIIKMDVILNPTNTINSSNIIDGDVVFVRVKDYDRITTSIGGNSFNCFDIITLNVIDKGNTTKANDFVSFKTEYTSMSSNMNDANNFIINPIDPNLNRFDIELYDKNGLIIQKGDIRRFSMTICVYSNRKKITMI